MQSVWAIVLVEQLLWKWPDPGADMKGFVAFHGGLGTLEGQDDSQAKGSHLILHDNQDKAINMDQFVNLTNQLEGAGLKHKMVTFNGAQHAFTVFVSEYYPETLGRNPGPCLMNI